jgi:progranulin
MLLFPQLYALPPALLLLLTTLTTTTASQHAPHPRDLSPNYKYYPEHADVFRRQSEIQQKLQWQRPTAMRKMSGDPGEKFYLEYWLFDDDPALAVNQTAQVDLETSLRVHNNVTGSRFVPRHLDPRGLHKLFQRDFECPTGSTPCTSINRPNSCCQNGDTCQLIDDTGYGDVGCCPSGQSCGNTLSGCSSGSTSCPNDGGGCCLPGYGCYEEGCVQTATTTILVGPSTSASPQTVTVTSVTTISPSEGPPETVTTTLIISATTTEQPDTTSATTSASETSSADCPENYRTCPASLGGGCCHTDRACGTGNLCPASTSSGLQPPNRPTSGDVTTTTAESSSASSESAPPGGGCPTGYYGCKAFHQGGCCQTGLDCQTTSCVQTASTTVVDTGGVTVAAPTGVSGAAAASGTCQGGWFSCGANEGGGCCPTGYGCAIASCTATAAPDGGSHAVGKEAPESAAIAWSREIDLLGVLGTVVVLGVALVLDVLL